jgi:hypothetical protein
MLWEANKARFIFLGILYALAWMLALAGTGGSSIFGWTAVVVSTPIVLSVVWAVLRQNSTGKRKKEMRLQKRMAQRDMEVRRQIDAEDAAKEAKRQARYNQQHNTPPAAPPPPPRQKP